VVAGFYRSIDQEAMRDQNAIALSYALDSGDESMEVPLHWNP